MLDKLIVDNIDRKKIWLKRQGAGILLKDQMSLKHWYLYKSLMATLICLTFVFISSGFLKDQMIIPISLLTLLGGWLFLDLMLTLLNKASNDDMMADICEMSRSVLYGKKGGQFISDALRDAVIVVENKRLKMALIRLRNDLDSGLGLTKCLEEFEQSFSNAEITSFCTVITSLQSTGQVNEASRTLENNIEREQVSINKRRCTILEHKTMMYVILIAMDLMAVILYCIIMKLLELTMAF